MGKEFPSNLTQGELDQAQHLIFKGKTHAAQGDPRMQRIINALADRGYKSGQSMIRDRQRDQQIQQPVTPQGQKAIAGGDIKFETKKFQGPVRHTTDRETFRATGIVKQKPEVTGRAGLYYDLDTKEVSIKDESKPISSLKKTGEFIPEVTGRAGLYYDLDTKEVSIKDESKPISSLKKTGSFLSASDIKSLSFIESRHGGSKDIVIESPETFLQTTQRMVTKPVEKKVFEVSGKFGGPTSFHEAEMNIKRTNQILSDSKLFNKITGGNVLIPGRVFKQAVIKSGSFIASYGVETGRMAVQNPYRAGGEFAVSLAMGGAFGTVTKLAKVSKFGQIGVGKIIIPVAEVGVGSYFVAQEVITQKGMSSSQRAKRFAEITPSLAGFGAGIKGSTKAVGFFGDRIKVSGPLRNVKDPTVKELQILVVKDKGLVVRTSYKMNVEVKPPMVSFITTPFRRKIHAKPLSAITITMPKKATIKTIEAVDVPLGKPSEPFFVSKSKGKGTQTILTEIKGTGKSINIKDIGKLSKIEQQAIKNLYTSETGSILSTKNVQKYYPRDAEFTIQKITSKDALKISKTGGIKPIKLGRRTKRFVSASRTKPSYETDLVEVSTFETQFQETTLPFSRAKKKQSKLTGELTFIKELKIETTGDVNVIKTGDGPKTSLSKTFQEQAQQYKPTPTIQTPIQTPPTSKTKVTFPKSTPLESSTQTMFQGSKFAGTGQYEITGGGLKPMSITSPVSSFETKSFQENFIQQKPVTKLEAKFGQKILVKQRAVIKTKTIIETREKTGQRSILKLKQRQQLKPVLKLMTRPGIKEPPVPTMFRGPKKKRRKTTLGKLSGKRGKEIQSGGGITVQLRRYGKFRTIGTASSATQAVSMGRQSASSTLGATFRILGAGKLRTPAGFYKGKGLGTFIEKSKFRLSTGTEKMEIQTAKRRLK